MRVAPLINITKMRKNWTISLIILVFIYLLTGCQKEPLPDVPVDFGLEKEGLMIIGDQMDNPYSVTNMQEALANVQAYLKSDIKVEPTHFYVRFRPKSEQELDLLTRDTTLDFYDYPLDCKINRGGTYYHDPMIPSNEITWQYTVVPVNYSFPKVQYQKLAELFLPEDVGDNQESKGEVINHADWQLLEGEALRITNNLNPEVEGSVNLKSTSWRPAGTIRVYDDVINSYSTTRKVFDHYEYYNCETGEPVNPPSEDPGGIMLKVAVLPPDTAIEYCTRAVYRYETSTSNTHFIPMEGVEVRARRWFTTYKGITDVNGNFVCDGTFEHSAEYSIKWERYDFDIRDGSYGQAYYNTGENQTGPWFLDIEENSTPKSFLFAHIFRAAYTYYYKNSIWGIKTPPTRDGIFAILQQRLHIAGKFDGIINSRSHYFDFSKLIQAAEVVVYKSTYNSRGIFGTSIHELAHASHWEMGYSTAQYVLDYLISDPKVPESWAVGVEWKITNDIYPSSIYSNYASHQGETISEIVNNEGYTPLVIDLIDNVNQSLLFADTDYPNDQVEGYTLSQLENALFLSNGIWWIWQFRIQDMFNNPTETYVDYLFQNYK
ncbi:MAG TPA: hypothetical protein PKZ64_18080 [Spirochaetota bacterium]|nr:hypothetical protein [Spirochaetota bacterium]